MLFYFCPTVVSGCVGAIVGALMLGVDLRRLWVFRRDRVETALLGDAGVITVLRSPLAFVYCGHCCRAVVLPFAAAQKRHRNVRQLCRCFAV